MIRYQYSRIRTGTGRILQVLYRYGTGRGLVPVLDQNVSNVLDLARGRGLASTSGTAVRLRALLTIPTA